MENVTNNNGLILNYELFTGMVKASKTIALESIWFDFKFAVECERDALLESFDEMDSDKKAEKRAESRMYGDKATVLRHTISKILSYDSKGEFSTDRMHDALDALTATEDKISTDAQVAYWERQERKKEEALKAEYLAGFDAWKEAQGL